MAQTVQNKLSKLEQRQLPVYLLMCDVRSYLRRPNNLPRREIAASQLEAKMKDLSTALKKCLQHHSEWKYGKMRFCDLMCHYRQLQFLVGRIFKGEVDAATFPTVQQRLEHLNPELEELLQEICDMFVK